MELPVSSIGDRTIEDGTVEDWDGKFNVEELALTYSANASARQRRRSR